MTERPERGLDLAGAASAGSQGDILERVAEGGQRVGGAVRAKAAMTRDRG